MKLVDFEEYYNMQSTFVIPEREFVKLIDRYNELESENRKLENDIKILLKENEAKEKVIIMQDNVLNELEKWLIDLKTPKTNYWGDRGYTYMLKIDVILDKLNELKESDK